ncbi:MAG: hypothetical protein HY043_23780 [Verrucomicrobia bacterium]|nr:hypothetical protein [Verrucomicrobiota bacterium]
MILECPHCKQSVEVSKDWAGQTIACPYPKCAREFLVPPELFAATSMSAAPATPDANMFDAGEFYRLERAGSESFYEKGWRYFKHDGKRIFVPGAREYIKSQLVAKTAIDKQVVSNQSMSITLHTTIVPCPRCGGGPLKQVGGGMNSWTDPYDPEHAVICQSCGAEQCGYCGGRKTFLDDYGTDQTCGWCKGQGWWVPPKDILEVRAGTRKRRSEAQRRKRQNDEESERLRPQREREWAARDRSRATARARKEWFKRNKTACVRTLGVLTLVALVPIIFFLHKLTKDSWLLDGILYVAGTSAAGLILRTMEWNKSDRYFVDVTEDGHIVYREPDNDFRHEMRFILDNENSRFVVCGAAGLTSERQNRILGKFDGQAVLQ